MRHVVLLLVLAGEVLAHGGTSHSAEMSVDNDIVIAPGEVRIEQIHRCVAKVAEDIWRATDRDGDGRISDAEWKQGVEDSKSVYQQWCKLEVDWKTALPSAIEVELASFPRTRPVTWAGAELTIAHRATYPAAGDSALRTLGYHCTSLNARTIRTTVRAIGGVRIEQASAGTLSADGTTVAGIEQVDGTPDLIQLVVRDGAGAARPDLTGRAPASQTRGEVGVGLLLLAAGFWKIVAMSIALGRGEHRGRSLTGMLAGFVMIGLGAWFVVWGLVRGGVITIHS